MINGKLRRLATIETKLGHVGEKWSLPVRAIDVETGVIGEVNYCPKLARVDYRNALHLVAPDD